jgi:flagellar L-ring protein precursor FlgH
MKSKTFSSILLLTALAFPLAADSLWTNAGAREQGLASDIKASRVGDILTIVVSENAAQTSSQTKSTNNASSVNASVSQFLFPAAASALGTVKGQLPATSFGNTSTFSGGGAVNNTQSVTASAAVLVTDVLPNGNLVIAGARRLTFAGETQTVVLHGLVRPADIANGNSVVSSNVADARIEFISDGTISDAEKRGWLTNLYDKLRPF